MKSLLALFFIALPLLVSAQSNYWQGGFFVGGSAFSGDINPQATPDPADISVSFGLIGRVDVTRKIGFKGSITYANLKGDDANYLVREARSFKFNTTLIELAGIAEWEPFGSNRYYTNARGGVEMDKLVSPYLFAGVGFGFARLNTDFSGYNGNNAVVEQGIQMDRAEGSAKTAFVMPMGVGLKFDVSNRITFGFEFGARLSFSDYLDGISKAGSPDSDDVYFIGGVDAYYRFFN